MAVEYVKEDGGTRRLRFTRGTAYDGADYYEGDEANVDARWATVFIQQGRAIDVNEEAPADAPADAPVSPPADVPGAEDTALKSKRK